MARDVWLLLPVAAAAVGAIGVTLLMQSGTREVPEEAEVVAWEDLDVTHDFVRVKGMAHYRSTITQRVPSSLIAEEKTWYVYGLFPVHDSDSRAIQVLVRSQKKPEELVSYEVMEVEGWVGLPVPAKIPPSTEAMLSKRSDYYFSEDVLLLESARIHSEDGVWVEP